jgi:hypothetical protein
MTKKLWILVLGMTLGLLGSYAPATPRPAFAGTAAQVSQGTVNSPAAQQLVLSGKILVEHGHYVFYNLDTKSTFRVANPSKVKPFKGDTVKIQGRIVASTHHLYVTKINSIM